MKLFLDANVIYSAARSSSGASYGIFLLKNKFKLQLFSSKLALIEAERNIVEKEDLQVLNKFYELIKTIKIVSVDSSKAKRYYQKIIDEKDAPILYGAKQTKTDYLITLDKKHFFTEKIKSINFSFKITTPGDFIMSLKSS